MENYFYRINNLINGKFYYGSHNGKNESYFGSGIAINRAIDKYGVNNFEFIILKRFNSREEAFIFEERFLKLYKISSLENSYNIKDAGLGGDTFSNNPRKEEIRKKQSKAQRKRFLNPANKANTNPFKDVSSERLFELKKIWSEASRGRLNGRAKKVMVKDKLYYTINEAAIGECLTREQVKYRLKNSLYKDFNYCDG